MEERLHNEPEIWRRLAAGDEAAFTVLFYHYNRRIYPFVLRKVKSDSAAEEIIQETFLKLWASREQIAVMHSPDGYLYRIAVNLTLDHLRKQARNQDFLDTLKNSAWQAPAHIEQHLYYRETKLALEKALEQLPPQRKTIYLLRQEGLTYEEIAAQLQISPNTVRNQLVSAFRSIREYLQGQGISMLIVLLLWKGF
ncbi:RNA polymerase sigma factor [Chitinophaga sp. 22620]|uniref:RNA polymerase sigma factor n=1 Tax=Chitinophaga sp. 22620 TaxID=3453952 RepID=UPI003F837265